VSAVFFYIIKKILFYRLIQTKNNLGKTIRSFKMKKSLIVLAAALTLMGLNANARVEQPLWTCALNFEANGGGLQLLLGSFKLTGPGQIRCIDIAGNQQDLDVKVTMGSNVLAPNFAIGSFDMMGMASGIGVARGPEALLGTYYTAGANGSAVIGVGANLALKGGREAVTINVAVNVLKGFGLQAGLNRLTIEKAN
jgi:hypothetical protein